jgi:hypothetical protein
VSDADEMDYGMQITEKGMQALKSDRFQGIELLTMEILARCPGITRENIVEIINGLLDMTHGNVEVIIESIRACPDGKAFIQADAA